ncbi:MAG: hypothetical protein ACRD4K_10605 [Candidatus Acidiferrales bacterium]
MGAMQTPSLPSHTFSALISVIIGAVTGIAVGLAELTAPFLRDSQTSRVIFVCGFALVVGVVASRVKRNQGIPQQS